MLSKNSSSVLHSACDYVKELSPYLPGKPIEELQREFGINKISKLASNENPLGASIRAIKAATQASFDLGRYPDGGAYNLKAALAELHGINQNEILIGNGSNDVLDILARCFLTSGTEAIFSEHAFAVYAISTKAAGAHAVAVPAVASKDSQQYAHNVAAFSSYVNEKTRVIFIANPNNPTGHWIKKSAIEQLLKDVPSNVLVVVDEAYAEYIDHPEYESVLSLQSEFPNLVITRTFSKAYGLAAHRVGYAIAAPELIEVLNRVRQPFNCNTVAQSAAIAAIGDQTHVEHSKQWNAAGLQQLNDGLVARKLTVMPSISNFVTFLLPGDLVLDDVNEQLLKQGVIVRPVANYNIPLGVRVSVGLEEEISHFFNALDNCFG